MLRVQYFKNWGTSTNFTVYKIHDYIGNLFDTCFVQQIYIVSLLLILHNTTRIILGWNVCSRIEEFMANNINKPCIISFCQLFTLFVVAKNKDGNTTGNNSLAITTI